MIADVSMIERFYNMASHLHHLCAELSHCASYRHLVLASRAEEHWD
jgi:hypothetical protein